jgi:hypothetical protein
MNERILNLPKKEIAELCRRWSITELALFGSVLRTDFNPESDVDILVSFSREARWSLFDLVRLQDEFEALLGRSVDLVERTAIQDDENYIRRKGILSSARIIYAAR